MNVHVSRMNRTSNTCITDPELAIAIHVWTKLRMYIVPRFDFWVSNLPSQSELMGDSDPGVSMSPASCGGEDPSSKAPMRPTCDGHARTAEPPRLTEMDDGGWRVDRWCLETWTEGGCTEAPSCRRLPYAAAWVRSRARAVALLVAPLGAGWIGVDRWTGGVAWGWELGLARIYTSGLMGLFLHGPLKVPSLVLANWWNIGLTFISKWMI
jgi:hypothetical protein